MMNISCMYEEILPFFPYLRRRSCLNKQRNCPNILDLERFSDYEKLCPTQLARRLDEEHQRASAIDEKTVKMTLSLSIGMTILGFMAGFFTKSEFDSIISIALLMLIALGLFFLLAAGWMATGALRTLCKYGYGTSFVLELQEDTEKVRILADALARQECMNDIRHLRNEASYQSLRNGFCLLCMWMLIFLVMTLGEAMRKELNLASSSSDSVMLRINEMPHCL